MQLCETALQKAIKLIRFYMKSWKAATSILEARYDFCQSYEKLKRREEIIGKIAGRSILQEEYQVYTVSFLRTFVHSETNRLPTGKKRDTAKPHWKHSSVAASLIGIIKRLSLTIETL